MYVCLQNNNILITNNSNHSKSNFIYIYFQIICTSSVCDTLKGTTGGKACSTNSKEKDPQEVYKFFDP